MLIADLRYAIRTLRRSPGFTVLAVISLALGIGANSAIFSLFDQFLLRPLPVRDAGELAIVASPGDRPGRAISDVGGGPAWSYPMYEDIRNRNEVFSGLLARSMTTVSISKGEGARLEGAELVSNNYFDVLGVGAAIGRVLTDGDQDVAVLSHGYWQRAFGGDPRALNSQIRVNGHAVTVVGVTAPEFFGVQRGQEPAIFAPIRMTTILKPNDEALGDRQYHWLHLIGRLKTGFVRDQAAASLTPLVRSLREQESRAMNLPQRQAERYIGLPVILEAGAQGRQLVQQDMRGPLRIALVLVGAVLLIACANVAGLLVARGLNRRSEIALRLAVGASRWQILRQLLIESVVLAGIAGVAAVFVAGWTIRGVFTLMGSATLPGVEPHLDAPLLVFHAAVALGAGLLLGLLPAFTASSLKPGERSWTRQTLVGAQIAITLALVASAGLFAKSLLSLRQGDFGIRAAGIVRFELGAELSGYGTERAKQLFDRLSVDLAALPGVNGVGIATVPVFNDSNQGADFTVEGYTPSENEDMEIRTNWISPGYFSTLGTPLVAGREFGAQDRADGPKTCVINEATARAFFKGRNPIGQRLAFGTGNVKPDIEIVGVVKDSKHANLRQSPRRSAFFPYRQRPSLGWGTFYVRTTSDPQSLMQPIRAAVARVDQNLPVTSMRTLDAQIDRTLRSERGLTTIALAFSSVAALLAGIGLYGAMALLVARRRREIGIRMALGARPEQVRWMVLREAGIIALAAAAVGLPSAYALGRMGESMLYQVRAWDPLVLLGATLCLLLLMMAATWIPARQAVRVNPAETLAEATPIGGRGR